ncbi:MAG: PqqD family protein [Clostridia bacterium]|nr:PqqD family protein [Clostridia bacterium]
MSKRKKTATIEEYIKYIPLKNPDINWSADKNGIVTLEMQNKGAMNKVFQLLFRKPKISYIHLDENGSFIWPLIDGEKSIEEIGKDVDAHFGEKAHPLYERLCQFFSILSSYKFITYK